MKKRALLILSVVAIAALLRLWNFQNHTSFGDDSMRDLLVARGSISLHSLPQVGSFSSAGPFVFSALWYWILTIIEGLFGTIIFAPWYFILIISLLFVYVMILVGEKAINLKAGLITGLLTGLSVSTYEFSSQLTQHTMVEICSGLTLLFFVLFLKSSKIRFSLLMSLSIGAAIAFHYEAISLLAYCPVLFLAHKPDKIWISKLFLSILLGLIIFPLPLFIWDSTRNWQNWRLIVDYFLVGQYRFWVSNRWLTYLGVFWTGFWGKMVGGLIGSYLLLPLFTLVATIFLFKRRLTKQILFIILVFGLQVLALRYFRGEKFDSYLVYLHAPVLILSGWVISVISKKSRLIGFALIAAVLISNILTILPNINSKNDYSQVLFLSRKLERRYPRRNFQIFGEFPETLSISWSTSYVTDIETEKYNSVQRIGICYDSDSGRCPGVGGKLIEKIGFRGKPYAIFDFSSVSDQSLLKGKNWSNYSKEGVYHDVQDWWKNEKT